MSASYLTQPMVFLINTLFSLYLLALMLRFIFQWVEAEFYNPISQFLVKITHPPLRILRRFIPPIGRIDTASIVLMLVLQMIAGYLVFALQNAAIGVGALFLWSVAELLRLFFNIFIFAVIIRAVLSWISPDTYNPVTSLLYSLTEPLLRGVRNFIPPISGIDLSPIVVLIGLQVTKMILLPPLQQAAIAMNY